MGVIKEGNIKWKMEFINDNLTKDINNVDIEVWPLLVNL